MMEKIKKLKKSYTQKEVDDYLKKLLTASELALAEQKDRIVELKNQIDKMKIQVDDYKEKAKITAKAMNEATRITKEFKKDSDLRRHIELEKLKNFGFRWKTYLNHLFSSIPQLDGNKSNILFEQEIIQLLDEMQELDQIKESKNEKQIPNKKSSILLDSNEWIEQITKDNEAVALSLSEENEKRFNELMKELKDNMTFSSMINAPNENFNLEEALNPKDDLNKIIGDII